MYGISIDATFLDENAKFNEDYTNITIDLGKFDDLTIGALYTAGVWDFNKIIMSDGAKFIYFTDNKNLYIFDEHTKQRLAPTEILEKVILSLNYVPSIAQRLYAILTKNNSLDDFTLLIRNIVFNMLKNNLIPQDKMVTIFYALFTLRQENFEVQKRSLISISQTMIDINNAALKAEQERLEQERLEQERLEQERLEKQRLENQRLEQERIKQELLSAIKQRVRVIDPTVKVEPQKKYVNVYPKTILSKFWNFIKGLIVATINNIVGWLYGTTPNVEIFTDPNAVKNLQLMIKEYEANVINDEAKVYIHEMSVCENTKFEKLAVNFLNKYNQTQDPAAKKVVMCIKDAQCKAKIN